ncbi:MAG: DUF262 domain-containing protein [Armatimonadia bacterium]
MFSPQPKYVTLFDKIQIRDFYEYADDFVVRPPYQRKNVWTTKKQQALLDSLIRRYYVPRIVIREVRLGEQDVKKEIIDGQQRIHTVQRFFRDELPLPGTLKDVSKELPHKRYSELPSPVRKFIDKELSFDVDIVKSIDNPKDRDHQSTAATIFWRLQQGESLNFMEIAHSLLSSLTRNFVVKYADDISFDYVSYQPLDGNPTRHPFFALLNRSNDRMQHLSLLARLLMLEFEDGPADIRDVNLSEFIEKYQREDGIGNVELESDVRAQQVLSCLTDFCNIFKGDPMVEKGEPVRELRIEYFILSFVFLLRHMRKYYALEPSHRAAFREFLYQFHQDWSDNNSQDPAMLLFQKSRQQGKQNVEVRHRVLREKFFRYLEDRGLPIRVKDQQRTFSEAQRLFIYRRDEGLCQQCLAEGKNRQEARVAWADYEADHVLPHSKGGPTEEANGQVLCSLHNSLKGACMPAGD